MTVIEAPAARVTVPGIDIPALLSMIVASPNAQTVTSVAPFTLAPIADIPQSTDEDVESAFASARRAQKRWAQWTPKERAKIFLRFHDLMLKYRTPTLDLIQTETGKNRGSASLEYLDTLITPRHYAKVGPKILKPKARRGLIPGVTLATELHHPKGVVGIIAPWNFPLNLAIADAIPALIAGNAIVIKPDSQTVLTALWSFKVLYEAGLPEGLVQIVAGRGSVIGTSVIQRADYMMFTGSTATGRVIAEQCGQRLIGCSMELGGKNPMIVLPDANIEAAAEVAVRGCFDNSGQICIAMERLYIADEIFDEFAVAFARRVATMKIGAGFDWKYDMGSLISEDQLKQVSAHVDDAVAKGAKVLTGGRARPDLGPLFYEPTVLVDMPEDAIACREETFGPVVALYRVHSVEEAIDRANDSEYGLNASVLTRDTRRGAEISARVRAGTVNVNEGYASAWGSIEAPMGGMGASGLGRRHGLEGILKYTEAQTVAVQRLLPLKPILGMSNEQFHDVFTVSIGLMKKLGMK